MPTTTPSAVAAHITSSWSSRTVVQVAYAVVHGAQTSNGRSARAAAETSHMACRTGSFAGSSGSTSLITTSLSTLASTPRTLG